MELFKNPFQQVFAGLENLSFLVCFVRYINIMKVNFIGNIIVSGSDEGVYAWVVANYALGTLGGDPQETTGIIELGGASAQVFIILLFLYISNNTKKKKNFIIDSCFSKET